MHKLAMITITLIALILAIPLSSMFGSISNSSESKGSYSMRNAAISSTLYIRIVAIALVFAALISFFGINSGPNFEISGITNTIDSGVGLYSGLLNITTITQTMEVFLFISGALILIIPMHRHGLNLPVSFPLQLPEYPIIILFTIAGGSFLLASADLVSMYLAIELQSFGAYILAALYRDSESATAAGLKYFLLGALSSALILLGCASIYSYTGTTALTSIYELISVPVITDFSGSYGLTLGIITILVGLLFKVASAPFHNWAPDVYDGTPTVVTTWLTVMPKISIFIFIMELSRGISTGHISIMDSAHHSYLDITQVGITDLLLLCSLLSLIIGTVLGLGQYRIKRLLAYSTISHVGFLLAALAVGSSSLYTGSVDEVVGGAGAGAHIAFLFYIVQYTLTNIDTFLILLAAGSIIKITKNTDNPDISFISGLVGLGGAYPILGLSIAICLFSMAGVPPLVGFFAKYTILYNTIGNGYIFLSIVAILASVVSAVYYLQIVRYIHFGDSSISNFTSNGDNTIPVTSVHSYVIASITAGLLFFSVAPHTILTSTSIMALSMYIA